MASELRRCIFLHASMGARPPPCLCLISSLQSLGCSGQRFYQLSHIPGFRFYLTISFFYTSMNHEKFIDEPLNFSIISLCLNHHHQLLTGDYFCLYTEELLLGSASVLLLCSLMLILWTFWDTAFCLQNYRLKDWEGLRTRQHFLGKIFFLHFPSEVQDFVPIVCCSFSSWSDILSCDSLLRFQLVLSFYIN